jgi:subtilisin family serine protease
MLAACSTTPSNQLSNQVRESPDQYLVLAVHNDDIATSINVGSTGRGYDSGNGYGQSARARKLLADIARDYHLQAVNSWPIQALQMECVVFKSLNMTPPTPITTIVEQLRHDKRVELAQPLNTFVTNTVSNDETNYQDMQLGMQRMNVPGAHQWSRGRGVRVAVIDTGMDTTHHELTQRIAAKRNFVDNDQSQFNHDRHGTAVAGVIAANLSDGKGIVGVAPEAELIALKACWQLQADRDDARCNSFTLAQALAGAIDARAHIINLSIIGPTDALLTALVERAQSQGIIVVGAADSSHQSMFPADVSGVIAVTAMEQSASSTNTINAPGRDVLTLIPGDRYDFRSGSSIATAEVSGTIALLLASQTNQPLLGSKRIRELLVSSTATSDKDNYSSVNACRALSQLLNREGCEGSGRTSGTAAR